MEEKDHTLPEEYLAFLLRLWREGDDLSWRAMLKNAHTGETHGFADVSQLLLFLQSQTELQTQTADHPPNPENPA
jgi:hypothetical protein